jgi:hypothetical protein
VGKDYSGGGERTTVGGGKGLHSAQLASEFTCQVPGSELDIIIIVGINKLLN